MRRIFDTNVFAALEMAQGAARNSSRRGGRIVWTSSVAGWSRCRDGAYSASKYAVEGFCAAMREELALTACRSAMVNPGAYRTGFNDTGMESQDQWWAQGERAMHHWPVRELTRQADPAEMIAAMIDVITSDHPPYRTVLPKAAEDMARREQAEEWEKRLQIWSLPAFAPSRQGARPVVLTRELAAHSRPSRASVEYGYYQSGEFKPPRSRSGDKARRPSTPITPPISCRRWSSASCRC